MKVLIPLAEGVEEMEAVIAIDLFRRAGWHVVAAGLSAGPVTASRGVVLGTDMAWADVNTAGFDALVLPGGAKGTENLRADTRILDTVRAFDQAGKWVAAVCAAPTVLLAAGILQGRRVTSHFSVADQFTDWVDEPVVWADHLLTSQGAGTCFAFALAFIARIEGQTRADELAKALVYLS